jgi:phosphatidylglycerol:prolipoprotein diacylglycerol transferase
MMSVIAFPNFDPVMIHLGPLSIRWYAVAYIVSLVLGWRVMRRLVRRTPAVATGLQTDDFLTWATLGVVLGGRLGYILFYQPSLYLENPAMILAVWNGGMSFHGGMLGVVVALILFTRRQNIPLLGFADRLASADAPISLTANYGAALPRRTCPGQ